MKLEGSKITFVDSMRLFPGSLNNLCSVFGVEGKTSTYNIEYNSISLFSPHNSQLLLNFLSYSLQDSVALFNALTVAQCEYMSKYGVDICSVVSLPSLAMKIFRKNYLSVNIPTLKGQDDYFIRSSYFGGATDVYKCHITENLRYYDVNSLYPYAMCKPMPIDLINSFLTPALRRLANLQIF